MAMVEVVTIDRDKKRKISQKGDVHYAKLLALIRGHKVMRQRIVIL